MSVYDDGVELEEWRERDLDSDARTRVLQPWEKLFCIDNFRIFQGIKGDVGDSGEILSHLNNRFHLNTQNATLSLHLGHPREIVRDLSTSGVHLDDYDIAMVANHFKPFEIHGQLPGEFDDSEDLRSKRGPQGFAAKL